METRASDFHFFLKSISQRFDSMAVFNSQFSCLHIHTHYLNNSVGLMTGLKALKDFFPWDGSQVVVHNDPNLGCSRLDRLQFLFSSESFHFSVEETFPLIWGTQPKILKIPPIPIVENRRLNTALLETLSNQPDCPANFQEFVRRTLEKIEVFQHDFKNLIKTQPKYLNNDFQKEYFNTTYASTLKTIKSKTYASSQLEYEFESNAFLKVKVVTSEIGIRIDFQGTTNHQNIQLADTATDSICFQFFADFFQFQDVMNESTFSLFQIAKPTQSFLNSKNFTNKFYSDFAGTDILVQALLDGMPERANAKPFLFSRSYFQIVADDAKTALNFDIPNARPIGSMGTLFLFDPVLSSKPMPSGAALPNFTDFKNVGIDVQQCQQIFKQGKQKDNNDYQTILILKVERPLRISVLNPCIPIRSKMGKLKSLVTKPSVVLKNEACSLPYSHIELASGHWIEIKSGAIEHF